MRHVARISLASGLLLSTGCGLEHLFGGLVDTEHVRIVTTLSGTTTNTPATVVVQKPDGAAVEPLSAAITGQSFVLTLASSEYTNSRVVAQAGENRLEILVPTMSQASSTEVAISARSTAQAMVLDAALSATGQNLTVTSPGLVRNALTQIEAALGSTTGVALLGDVETILAQSDPASTTRIFRAPAFDASYAATQSTIDPAWLAAHPSVATTTTAFDRQLGELASGINVAACLDPVNIRVVLEVNFNDGLKDGNCDPISRFKWVRDAPGKSMYFVGGLHEESPIQDPLIDARLGNPAGWNPNTIQMFDDGTNGDAVAGDNIWTFTTLLPRTARIGYKYTWGTFGALWTGSEEWPGNQHILEIVDVNGDNIVYRRDNFGEEATNKDKSNLYRRGSGVVTWDTDANRDGIPDARERPNDIDNDCVLDEFVTPEGIGPATIDCE